jgi:hypothetical protein
MAQALVETQFRVVTIALENVPGKTRVAPFFLYASGVIQIRRWQS